MLARAQGRPPERFYVVTPETVATIHEFRVDDYAAYFRLVRRWLEETIGEDDEAFATANYPEPVDHCDVCPWSSVCSQKRRADDHLSLVAGISRLQRRELEARDIATLAGLAKLPLPLPFKPTRGATATFERVRSKLGCSSSHGRASSRSSRYFNRSNLARGCAGYPNHRAAICFSISKAIRSPAKAAGSSSSVS